MPNFDIPTPNVDKHNKNLKSVSSLKKDFDVATPLVDSYNYAQETNMFKSYVQPSYPAVTTESGTINHFLTKLDNWVFCPPSSNLWTIKIEMNDGGNLESLYGQILNANSNFTNLYDTKWGVAYENILNNGALDTAKTTLDTTSYVFLLQDGNIGLFLANQISFDSHAAQINTSPGEMSNHSGFLTFPMTVMGKGAQDKTLKINFLQTNWDIGEILIDPWIAAILQQGLIEAKTLPKIKAKLTLNEYSAGIPRKVVKEKNLPKEYKTWFLRKQIVFNKIVPFDREGKKLSYSSEDAGKLESCLVQFKFENYKITYNSPSQDIIFVNNHIGMPTDPKANLGTTVTA